MNFIDIACMRSIAFSTQCDLKSEPILPIGEIGENKYWSYLYFNLQFAYISEIYKAELVLYKIPNQSSNKQVRRRKNRPQRIVVIPTNDYVSPYTYSYSPPQISFAFARECITSLRAAYTTIDVTNIVKAWSTLNFENRGMMLFGQTPHRYEQYAGANYECGEMKPFLHIYYEEKQGILSGEIIDLPITVKKV